MDLFLPQIDTEDFDGGQVGRLGEILTTFNLELHGIRTEIVRGQGSDLWCELPCGDMIRCEVKTARRPMPNNEGNALYYKFKTASEEQRKCQFFAFVALDTGVIYFMPTDELSPATMKFIPEHKLVDGNMIPSLEYTLDRLGYKLKKAA